MNVAGYIYLRKKKCIVHAMVVLSVKQKYLVKTGFQFSLEKNNWAIVERN